MGGLTGQEIYLNFNSAQGTNPLQAIAAELVKLQSTYGDRAQSIKDLQSSMEAAWTGEGGASARAGAGPLATGLTESAGSMDTTVGSMKTQADAWHQTANSVEPVPPLPEKPNPWTTGLKAAIPIAGPFMAHDDISTYQDGVEAHNRAAAHNVEMFTVYSTHTSANSTFPTHYTVLEPSGASITVNTGTPSAISGDFSGTPGGPRGGGIGAGPVSVGGPVSGPVTTGTGPTGGSPSPGPVGTGPGTTPPSTPTGPALVSPLGRGGDGTDRSRRSTAGPVSTPASPPAAGGKPRPGTGGPGRTGGGIGERAGSRLYGSGAARGGGPEAAAGARSPQPEGARPGVAGPKGTGAATPGAGAAAAEAAARNGTSGARGAGMAPMGAGGTGRGKSEDDEHQRASFLQENDPDAVFIGDLGRTAPPVIGE